MSQKVIVEAMVLSPESKKPRRGRGFSIGEIRAAGIHPREAPMMGLIVDRRRRTTHSMNVDILKEFISEIRSLESTTDSQSTEEGSE
ncbi:MAG: ribosomal protein L13e [Candidatus Thorarchaeota archaeon]